MRRDKFLIIRSICLPQIYTLSNTDGGKYLFHHAAYFISNPAHIWRLDEIRYILPNSTLNLNRRKVSFYFLSAPSTLQCTYQRSKEIQTLKMTDVLSNSSVVVSQCHRMRFSCKCKL